MDRPWQDEQTLRQMYVHQQMSTPAIAEELGCSAKTVNRWLGEFDIEVRSRSESVSMGHLDEDTRAVLTDEDTLREWYHVEGLSLPQMTERLDCSIKTVDNWMERHGIEKRSISEARSERILTEDGKRILLDGERLEELYHGENNPTRVIAAMADCHPETVRNYLHAHGIEVREACAQRGELNPAWKGGHTLDYGPNWPEQRQKRLEYDDHQCVICGITSETHYEKFGCDLNVHHIKPLRVFDGDTEAANRLENLITLCLSHHSKWEGIPLRPVPHD